MNMRRLSYGLLVTLAAAGLMIGCGDSTPPPEPPPQPTAAAMDSAAPTTTAAAEPPPAPTPPPEPPPPPPKPAKEKFAGKFVQQFDGDVKAAAEAVAQKKGKGNEKRAAHVLEGEQKTFEAAAITLDNTDKKITWTSKGKTLHELEYEISGKADDPTTLTIKLVKDGKKNMSKKPIEVSITFKDDNTFEMADPWAKKDPKKLIFKK